MASANQLRKDETRQQASQLATLVSRAQADPIWFAEEVLQLKRMEGDAIDPLTGRSEWELDDWQKDLLNIVADVWRKKQGLKTVINHDGTPWITMRAMHGPGKTFGMAAVDHLFNFCFRGRIFATAPKLKQVLTQLFPEFRKILGRAQPWYQELIEVSATTIKWCDDVDWSLLPDSAANPENMAGKHWDYVLVNVDEASGVDEALWPVLYGILSVGKVLIMLCISNPTKSTGTYAEQHLKPALAQDYFRYHISLDKTRRVQRSWVAKMIRKYGANSPVVRVRCYGEFPGDSPNQVIALEWLDRARRKEVDAMVGDGSAPRLRISVDVGAGGDNESVCTAMRHFQSMRIGLKQSRHSFPLETSAKQTADTAEAMFLKFGGRKEEDDFVVDSLGVGVGAAGHLYSRGYKVVMYQGGSISDDATRWRCRRVQSYMGLRDDLRDDCLSLLDSFFDEETDWGDFDAQLCSIQHPPSVERVDDLVTKEAMRKQGLASPDMADSIAMQYATQAPAVIPRNLLSPIEDNMVDITESAVLEGWV